jgi:hypothetical protein
MGAWLVIFAGAMVQAPTAGAGGEVYVVIDGEKGEVVQRLPLAQHATAFSAIRAAKLPAPASQWKKMWVFRSGPNSEQIALPIGEFTEAILNGTADETWDHALQAGDRIYLMKPFPDGGARLCTIPSPLERVTEGFKGFFSWLTTVEPIRPTSAGSSGSSR